jgi:hypothetical protein
MTAFRGWALQWIMPVQTENLARPVVLLQVSRTTFQATELVHRGRCLVTKSNLCAVRQITTPG